MCGAFEMILRIVSCFLALLVSPGLTLAGQVGVGYRAPAFTLEDWEGHPVSLVSFRGKVVCVDFWASWCVACTQALPALDAIGRRHRSAGLEILAVNIDEDRAKADRFLAERLREPSLTPLRDPGGNLLARFGAKGMPALYLIDRDGVVRLVDSGYSPDQLDLVERKLAELLGAPESIP